MISGPITRYQEIEQDLYAGNRADYQGFCFGLQRILWGLFKKLVIADRMAPIVQEIWSGDFYGWCVLIGVLGYAWQLYMDFSGCMDVVLGASELFGIRLPENFNTPLYATSLSEYWRRWHITLGAWVKDYVMYPILKTKGLQTRAKKWKKKYGKKMGKKMTNMDRSVFYLAGCRSVARRSMDLCFRIRSVFLSYDRWWADFRADW